MIYAKYLRAGARLQIRVSACLYKMIYKSTFEFPIYKKLIPAPLCVSSHSSRT